ncbi:NAD(P)-dependent oxidoreductase [Acidisoma cellulosilytica]|uniref:NAD(P)-dependent oxidoreductase n=1 Tax=Acidisoma cellulosilyticum TaxID=2802395 RepID=A0A964E5B5_9PROT|nr:NAD(P)-dependent oxidoreductase [Acidisoma cellulosilyticum]
MAGRTLGFVGVGRMGGFMTQRLLAAGHSVVVTDPSAEAVAALVAEGATSAGSPAEVASLSDIVFASLPSPAVVETVALGAKGVADGGRAKIFVDLSTTGSRVAAKVAEGLTAKGVVAVDCPVSGGLAGAKNGTLAVMVSCPAETYADIEPILKIFGKLFYVGEKPGSAQTLKLVNNLLAACAMAISAEGMVMGMKAGLDPKVMIDVINVSSGRNSAIQDKFPRSVLPGTFDFGFMTGLSYKDVRLCLDEAEAMGIPMVVGSAVRQMLAMTNAVYGPDSDFTSMVRNVETWAGVEVRG